MGTLNSRDFHAVKDFMGILWATILR